MGRRNETVLTFAQDLRANGVVHRFYHHEQRVNDIQLQDNVIVTCVISFILFFLHENGRKSTLSA